MAKKDKVIKITNDGKFHSMGIVVDTIDEAIKRCEEKGRGTNIFLTLFSGLSFDKFDDVSGEVCGSPEYIKEWATALSR